MEDIENILKNYLKDKGEDSTDSTENKKARFFMYNSDNGAFFEMENIEKKVKRQAREAGFNYSQLPAEEITEVARAIFLTYCDEIYSNNNCYIFTVSKEKIINER